LRMGSWSYVSNLLGPKPPINQSICANSED
jgi:hypothetical protein